MRIILELLEWSLGRLPPKVTAWLGGVLGDVLGLVLRLRRRVLLSNLAAALPLSTRVQRLRLARGVYRHLGRVALEYFQLARLKVERARALIGAQNLQRLQSCLSRGRGVLVLSAHLGNWDLLACSAALCGIRVNVITRRIKNRALDQFWMGRRARCGVRLLPAEGSAKSVMRALRRNEIVVFVLDQHAPGGEVVPFFGRPAATSSSLARVARASRAPVVPAFMPRRGEDYVAELLDPLPEFRTGDRSKDLRAATQCYSSVIERLVRQYPTQWLWVHRRWKVDPSVNAARPLRTHSF
jgi:KDO2-lipid IV(A) lauroyltransferase